MLHKTRELLVKQRTMAVNALRGHLSEFGLIARQGHPSGRGTAGARGGGRTPSRRGQAGDGDIGPGIQGLDAKIDALEKKIAQASAKNPMSRLAQ